MKAKKFTPAMRGLAALMTCLMVLSIVGTGVANTYRGALDDTLGTESYVTINDDSAARFKTDYATIEDMAAAARDIAIREGEEGTVVMKNDNGVLPLKANANVALFGLAAYNVYGPKGGNADAASLADALAGAGLNVNETLKDYYMTNIINMHTEMRANRWTGKEVPTTVYDHMYVSAPGDWTTYQIAEVPPAEFEALGVPANWKEAIAKDSIGICVFARGAGEGNTYKPGSALNYAGEATGEDPLKLSADELAVVEAAKETCSKVIVLLNTGNNMMIADIAEGGSHEVDGICYIGCPNDYQTIGIANVLTGKVNATGALASAFVRDHQSIPAVQNVGGDYFADYEIVCRNDDPRYPGKEIGNIGTGSFGGADTYNGGMYIVEAEGIYVGYKYYETRYFDAVMGQGNANSAAGATQGSAWNYSDEMLYTFGHGLSYLDYTQTIKSVTVDRSVNGNITAVVEVKNNSNQDGKFLTQLYVQQPYTDYDRTNLVEKSAVMFLNSAKVDVAAGKSKEVTITIPTKYLASYDANNAKTYILDAGDYYFTAAAGAHEAVNNILAAQGKTVADGMDAAGSKAVVSWKLDQLDNTTFAIANNTTVTNVADDADLNYWLPGTVTYLTRQDWNTFPINYNKLNLKIADSPKKDQWIAEMRGETYTISDTGAAAEAVPGPKFTAAEIGAEQLNNINDPYWDKLVHAITIDEAVGAVIHGGSRSDTLTNIDNPVVIQNEGPTGISAGYTDEATGKTYKFNVNSQTLLGCSFNPELAYQWGLVEGNSCLWVERYDLWGSGLTLNRTPYNGRNYEYISEDPMLTNVIGREVIQGCSDKGIINGPKHMGFNDQEHNRAGISAYMTEQKFRETDLRGFEGALSDAFGMGVMIAFNRIGATNASHHVGMIQKIVRGEWGFKGLISTDMMNNYLYFNAESMVMAGITQVADFAADNSHINLGEGGVDAVWPHISLETVSKDSNLVEQARENLKYQLYIFANSAILNISTQRVNTWWDTALTVTTYASSILAVLFFLAWVVLTLLPEKKPVVVRVENKR
ncbi:MAG: glycoside hydrolase family 3 C-terminal domain-containing protein [Christensenellales bacterium]|jgi:beta-glucosidase|nr:glycoside hydrolase family 3 C-terminal domain-containing protein [Christensenellales bacterium]